MHSSREAAKPRSDIEGIARIVLNTAFQLHKDLGPELLESVYEDEGFRLDLLVDKQRIVELKSVEKLHPVHPKQLQTHLRLIDISLGLLINFGVPLIKDGLKRVVNQHSNFTSSRLRVHQKGEPQ